jgi:hypothetical protein
MVLVMLPNLLVSLKIDRMQTQIADDGTRYQNYKKGKKEDFCFLVDKFK